jgi:phospholipid transport system substrate-binding protein
MHVNRIFKFILAATLGVAINASAASTPDMVVAEMTERVLAASAARGSTMDPTTLKALIEAEVMSHVNFETMTSRAVGPKWRTATDQQKARLAAGFEALLVKTYAGALNEEAGARFRLKHTSVLEGSRAEVRSDVTVRGGRDPIDLNYRLERQDEQWKIVDVSVLGVWLVPTYQTQFAQQMERSGGLDGLIRALEDRSKAR